MAGKRIWYSSYASALGPVRVACSARGVTDVGIRTSRKAFLNGLKRVHGPGASFVEDALPFRELFGIFESYFAGGRVEFDLPLDLSGSAFTEAVWGVLSSIPRGETISYATAASRAGSPGAARAAGTACAANPVPIIVPCHRVVRADGTLGGYSGGGAAIKSALLRIEGLLVPRNSLSVVSRHHLTRRSLSDNTATAKTKGRG